MTNLKRDILIITGRYLPGYKDGGPVRTIKNLTDYLGDEYNFRILTSDRDHGDTERYPNIKVNDWNVVGKAQVYYVSTDGFTRGTIAKLASNVDLVYVCGCFSEYAINTLIANRLGKIKVPVVIAAMGLFSPMSFRMKYIKKKMFMIVFNFLGMFQNVYWSATSEMEISMIRKHVCTKVDKLYIAEDLPRKVDVTPIVKQKKVGFLNVVWISRIVSIKNLKLAIEILKKVIYDIDFTIYGPIQDQEYWNECKLELEKLPPNIKWQYKGNVESERVVEKLKRHHVFLFPTLGENYGHVIQEALSAGCPCILSDQTPWQNLQNHGAGYVFNIDKVDDYVKVLEEYANMSEEQFSICVSSAHRYAIEMSNSKMKNTGYRDIFEMFTRKDRR